jgi:hypothetical protein
MVNLEILPGTKMATFETLPGTAKVITIKRAVSEPVMTATTVFSDCSIEVTARIEVWSMETMTREITFASKVFIGPNIAVTVVMILVDVRISKP